MAQIYPDLEWYSAISERKNLTARCPYAAVMRCPRYYESLWVLGDVGVMTKMSPALENQASSKWKSHELAPPTGETAPSASGGNTPNCYSHFCPEVAFDIFGFFADTVIRFDDDLDRDIRYKTLQAESSSSGKDWRRDWQHIEPVHYSECPIYSKLKEENPMAHIHINGPITGQVNIAGETINSPALSLTLNEIVSKIEASNASPEEKRTAISKLKELLAHPLVTAIAGGLAGYAGK